MAYQKLLIVILGEQVKVTSRDVQGKAAVVLAGRVLLSCCWAVPGVSWDRWGLLGVCIGV